MALATDFREYVRSQLEPALGITLSPGKVDGGVERRWAGCIWSPGWGEVEGQVNDQEILVTVRLFAPVRTQAAANVAPQDPAPLEEKAELLQTTWREHVHGGGVWFSRVVLVEIDLDLNMVEAQLIATTLNVGVVAP